MQFYFMPPNNAPDKNRSDLTNKSLPRPQKNAVIFLSAVAVLIVVGWVWQMRAEIRRPFVYNVGTDTTSNATTTDYINALKSRDTDGDGLSDYDEIYVYHTSPYLEDSDSDGIPDLQEIQQGTDPNCPQGKDCSAPIETAASSSPVVATSTNNSDQTVNGSSQSAITLPADLSSVGINTTTLQNALSGQVDAATLRNLLIAGGANKADLDKISDADLMNSYQNTLNSQSQSQNQTTP